MSIPLFTVDAFTDSPFRGNPAAVCLLKDSADESWMQNVAREMNLSETAFVVPGENDFHLRWFTPAAEVDLCGHATLAAAHVLWQEQWLMSGEVARFHTKSGLLTVTRTAEDYEMDFPREPAEPADPPAGLLESIGAKAVWTGRNRMDLFIELASEGLVRELTPDFTRLKTIETRGIIVTARADGEDVDFVSRFFCPRLGIDEDPVTGSAHCSLAPYWQKKLNKNELSAFQASRRGGFVGLTVRGNRVLLRGQAVTVLRGELVDGLGL